jgi:hypothetical protein
VAALWGLKNSKWRPLPWYPRCKKCKLKCEMIWKIRKKIVKRYGNYGRKISQRVKRFGKYRRK